MERFDLNSECSINFTPDIECIAWLHPITIPLLNFPHNTKEVLNKIISLFEHNGPFVVALDGLYMQPTMFNNSEGAKLTIGQDSTYYPIIKYLAEHDCILAGADFISNTGLDMIYDSLGKGREFIGVTALAGGIGGLAVSDKIYNDLLGKKEDKSLTRRAFVKGICALTGSTLAWGAVGKILEQEAKIYQKEVQSCIDIEHNTDEYKSDLIPRNVLINNKIRSVAGLLDKKGVIVLGTTHFIQKNIKESQKWIGRESELANMVLEKDLDSSIANEDDIDNLIDLFINMTSVTLLRPEFKYNELSLITYPGNPLFIESNAPKDFVDYYKSVDIDFNEVIRNYINFRIDTKKPS